MSLFPNKCVLVCCVKGQKNAHLSASEKALPSPPLVCEGDGWDFFRNMEPPFPMCVYAVFVSCVCDVCRMSHLRSVRGQLVSFFLVVRLHASPQRGGIYIYDKGKSNQNDRIEQSPRLQRFAYTFRSRLLSACARAFSSPSLTRPPVCAPSTYK